MPSPENKELNNSKFSGVQEGLIDRQQDPLELLVSLNQNQQQNQKKKS